MDEPRGDANVERFIRNMSAWQVSEEGREALQSLPRLKMLVLGEDWCPDVYRGLPVLAEIAATAGWEIRIFARDENNDIMSEFLKDGLHESIPTAVMYTMDHEYVGHWIERPAVANEHMANMQKLFSRKEGESEDEMRARIRQGYRDLQSSDEWASWRDETVHRDRRAGSQQHVGRTIKTDGKSVDSVLGDPMWDALALCVHSAGSLAEGLATRAALYV